jgi:hypothetical protein
MTRKIYNVALWAWGGRQCCQLRDGMESTASRARGGQRRGDDGIAGTRTTASRA